MSKPLRHDLIDLFERSTQSPLEATRAVLTRHEYPTDRVQNTDPMTWAGPPEYDEFETLSATEQRLLWCIWALNAVPLGLVLAGPVYQENPVLYANDAFQQLTGYDLADVRGRNLRLLQGPGTEPDPVEDLREALDIWTPVTVELRNYRKDGSLFRNRVSLVPVDDGSGTITNWIGIQNAIQS